MSDTALVLDHLVKTFNAHSGSPVAAVRDVDLTVDRGEIVAFLGPNGAGKTTTLDLILGLSSPTSGTVSVLGRNPHDAVSEGLISAVLQTGGLLRDLSIGETVRMIASLYDHPLAPDEAIERAGLSALVDRKVAKCSGGEQQRLRFALALLPEPELLVLDEPTSGMDVNARHEFWATMRQEVRGGRTILFATHYLQEADDFAERIVLLDHGRVIADGTTAELRERGGRHTVQVRWTSAGPADIAAVSDAVPETGAPDRAGDRLTWRTAHPDDLARYLLTRTPADHLEVRTASLDDAFTELTGNGSELTGSAR